MWWFDFDPRVRLAMSDGRTLPGSGADTVIVTSWRTAALVGSLAERPRRIVQVAYDYEEWMTTDQATRVRMAGAFAVPDEVVATSGVVESMLREMGREPVARIACAIDHDVFRLTRDPAARAPAVGFFARMGPTKRGEDALRAAEILRVTHPAPVVAVAAPDVPLPAGMGRLQDPTDAALADFYNSLTVFVLPSAYEGWGLTAVEAMACGAAVVTTASGGTADFAVDGTNALVVPPYAPEALAAACRRLLDDVGLRSRLVAAGVGTAAAMRWDPAVDALEALLGSGGGAGS